MEVESLSPPRENPPQESNDPATPLNGTAGPCSSSVVSNDAVRSGDDVALADAANSIDQAPSPKKSRGTFELKFLVDDDQAKEIIVWARQHLDADPHFDPEFGDGYRVNSLYLDTPQFDVFHRIDGFRQQKYRLRRYGRESLIWFEQKRKRKGLVRKRRVPVQESEVSSRLILPAEMEWDGHWFRRKVDEQALRPVSQIIYQRFARIKTTDDGLIRLTIDDGLTARLVDDWEVPSGSLNGVSLLDGRRILELKFRGAMPGLFKRLIEQQQLQVTSFSKYRTSVERCVPKDRLMGCESKEQDNA